MVSLLCNFALISNMYLFRENTPVSNHNLQIFVQLNTDLFKVLRDSLIYSDLYPPCQIKGVSIFRARLSPRPRHRSVPSAYALHAAAQTAPMRMGPVDSKEHAVKRALVVFVSCCCLPLIDTMITPIFSVRIPLKRYETARTRKQCFSHFVT